jgi:two-component sensor histidine kinase
MGLTAARNAEAENSPDAALTLLVGAVEQLALARTVEEVAAIVKSTARRISGADGVTFVLRDGESSRYLDEDAIGPLWKGRSFPLNACISGWAMLHGETAMVADVYKNPRIQKDDYRPTFVKSLVMTPVRAADPVAAIGAYWARARTPSSDEVARLSAVARITATALENVALISNLEESIRRRDGVIQELDHRVKNNLTVVRAIAQQSLRSAASPEAFNEAFMGRLLALSRAHELVARQSRDEARLTHIIEQALSPHADPRSARVSIVGPEVRVSAEAVINVLLAVHELGDNAVRYGSLGVPGGQLHVSWTVADDALAFHWREVGGGPAVAPDQRGFGLRMIQDGLPRSLGGKAETTFSQEGFSVVVTAPLSASLALS